MSRCGLGCGLGSRAVWHGPGQVRLGAREGSRSRRADEGLDLKQGGFAVGELQPVAEWGGLEPSALVLWPTDS